MSNTLLFIWVKNVYRLSYNWFKLSVVLSPVNIKGVDIIYSNNVKMSVVQVFILFLNKSISTVKNSVYCLLINFYTHYPQSLLLRPLLNNLKER